MTVALRHRTTQAADFDCSALKAAEHPLRGHSGARVVLHSNGKDSFVRKTAADAPANARLQAQAAKQQALWMHGLPFPKLRSQRLDESGIASFDMHYIPGRTVADAVANGGAFDPASVTRAVGRMTWLFRTTGGGALAPSLFTAKIEEVVNRAAQTVEESGLLDDVRGCGRLLAARDWAGIPGTPCHGDLTLENILLTAGGSIAFIDCDETFASSFWLDFGKLFQDIDGHWCIRALYASDAPSVRRLNAIQKLEQLGAHLRALAAQCDAALPPRLPQLAALGLLRAIPYARNAALVRFLCARIRRLLEA